MKKIFFTAVMFASANQLLFSQTNIVSGRLNEVFRQTVLVNAAANLNDPWEVAYGPDDSLWVTEARGYLVRKIHPSNGGMRTILNLTETSTFTPATYRRTFASTQNPWPQGGMMGLAIHPEFMTNPLKKFVYIAYVRSYTTPTTTTPLRTTNPFTGEIINGYYFTTWLVRFTYDGAQLGNPVTLCDTVPGSNDHNSGRLLIRNEGGTNYLYYSVGDVGGGQFANIDRAVKSQNLNSYEGKILRFNLEEDADADQGAVDYNKWIPNTNPFNATLGVQSAVWATGIRNNQGFAFGNINGTDRMYGASHGPFSDDEINLLQLGKNYGHPLVIGYSADGNYNNAKPGPVASWFTLITSESANATAIGSSYMDPMYSNYPAPAGTGAAPWTPFYSIQTIYQNPNIDTNPGQAGTQQPQNNNGMWWSEGYSGLGLYTNNKIPDWKNSLLFAALKWGRVGRMKLNSDGSDILNGGAGGQDTVSYFGGTNRFRDVEVAPNGKDIYVVMDRSTSSSGPSAGNPVVPACAGCVHRYEFLGYNPTGTAPFPSTIPTSIPVEAGTLNNCVAGNTVTINAANNNNNLWVPITGPDGNIIAEIDANNNNLGTVTTSFYTRTGNPVRQTADNNKYLNRNITINVQTQPSTPVGLRLYITEQELNDMIATAGSGVTGINDLGVKKNNNPCGSTFSGTAATQTVTGRYTQSTFGRALQMNVSSFSTFYFFSTSAVLPVEFITISAKAQNTSSKIQWVVTNQDKIASYQVERSIDNRNFDVIGTLQAVQQSGQITYNFTDFNASGVAKTLYYRIRAVEETGAVKYTGVANVSFGSAFTNMVTAYPNPAGDQTILSVTAAQDETAQIRVLDNTGRTVQQRSVNIIAGKNNFEINLKSLPAGLYYVDITANTFSEKIKLIKQ